MSSNIADALITDALQTQWCITESGLSTILAVLTRTNVPPEALERDRGAPLTNDRNAEVTIRDGVAIIEASGPMVRRGDFFSRVSAATSYDRVARDLAYALDAPNARAVLLMVDSPGGTVTGVSDLAAMIRAGTARKPIVVHTDGTLASAAYWLASAATEIVASPTALVGSIGIVMAMQKERSHPNDRMATFEFVSSQSPKKRVDPATDAGRAQILATVDAMAQVFVETVARYRGVTPATVLARFGQGDVLVGQQALDAGMIDRIGTFEETFARLAGRAPSTIPARVTPRTPAAAATAVSQQVPAAASTTADTHTVRAERLRAAQRRTGTLRDTIGAEHDGTPATVSTARRETAVRPATGAPAPVSPASRQARMERLRAAQRRVGSARTETTEAGHELPAVAEETKSRATRPSAPAALTVAVPPDARAQRKARLQAALMRAGLHKSQSS